MKKYIRSVFCAVLALCAAVLLCSCSSSPPEKPEISTTLTLSSSFEGTRIFSLTLPSPYKPGSSQAESLENVVSKYCPSQLTYSSSAADDKLKYTFILPFSSYTDYTSKLNDILGSKPVVVFSNPDTPLTHGWRIDEYFQSYQLLSWLNNGLRQEKLPELELADAEAASTVSFNGETVSSVSSISANKLTGFPISAIKIDTVNSRATLDRTVSFTIPLSTFDALSDSLKPYFESITKSAVPGEWELGEDNNSYIYTVRFNSVTFKELEGYTNRLMSSVYGDISYLTKDKSSTALAYQNSYTETLDFSSYISEDSGPVPVTYTYSLADDTEMNLPEVYSDFEWVKADPDKDTSTLITQARLDVTQPSLTVRITDGRQYVPDNISITLTPLDNDTLKKTISFCFDIEKYGHEATDYSVSYFQGLGLAPSSTDEGGKSVCSVSFSGTADELTKSFSAVFGANNLTSLNSETPFFTLRTSKNITDKLDLASLLVGRNYDTPVIYTLLPRDGESADYLTLLTTDGEKTEAEHKEDVSGLSVTTGDPAAEISAGSSSANWSDIIVFILISAVMLLSATALIFILRGRKPTEPPAENLPGLGAPDESKLAVLPRTAGKRRRPVQEKNRDKRSIINRHADKPQPKSEKPSVDEAPQRRSRKPDSDEPVHSGINENDPVSSEERTTSDDTYTDDLLFLFNNASGAKDTKTSDASETVVADPEPEDDPDDTKPKD